MITTVIGEPTHCTQSEFANLRFYGPQAHERPIVVQTRGQNSPALHQIERMIKEMPYISERLSSLRQEIADLRNLNARFAEKGGHNALDQTALELRTNRLREIKQELSKILNRPDDPKVWWERSRRPQQQA